MQDHLLLFPELLFYRAGYRPDPWQVDVLRHIGSRCTCVSRQRGKTLVAVAAAIQAAIVEAPCTVLYTARTLRQVRLFMRRVREMYVSLQIGSRRQWRIVTFREANEGRGPEPDLGLEERLAGEWRDLPSVTSKAVDDLPLSCGSRIVGIPPKEETVRGYDRVARIIIDEASRVPDDFARACGAFLATTGGYRDLYSTPFGQRGFFWELLAGSRATESGWKRTTVKVLGCQHSDPMCAACRAVSVIRITPEWLAQERREIGDRWYRQEYLCSFEANVGQLIPQEQIEAASRAGAGRPALWPGW